MRGGDTGANKGNYLGLYAEYINRVQIICSKLLFEHLKLLCLPSTISSLNELLINRIIAIFPSLVRTHIGLPLANSGKLPFL